MKCVVPGTSAASMCQGQRQCCTCAALLFSITGAAMWPRPEHAAQRALAVSESLGAPAAAYDFDTAKRLLRCMLETGVTRAMVAQGRMVGVVSGVEWLPPCWHRLGEGSGSTQRGVGQRGGGGAPLPAPMSLSVVVS